MTEIFAPQLGPRDQNQIKFLSERAIAPPSEDRQGEVPFNQQGFFGDTSFLFRDASH
jgi:hypothetical protein